jgi:hypothetical protein
MVGMRSDSPEVTAHSVGASGGTLVGTIDSGTVSFGPRHLDRTLGSTQVMTVTCPFFTRQQAGSPSSGSGGRGKSTSW